MNCTNEKYFILNIVTEKTKHKKLNLNYDTKKISEIE